MSIVTLQRKTNAKTGISHNVGFYLNGTHRSQGYVGQTNLSRHFTYTHMRHGAPMGHGGCCTSNNPPMQLPAVTSLENIHAVKPSTMSTSGLLSTKYRWVRRGQPFTVVKSSANNQTDYLTKLKKRMISECNLSKKNSSVIGSCRSCANTNLTTPSGVFSNNCRICKSETNTAKLIKGAMKQSDYLEKLHNKCAPLNIVYEPNANKGTPIACRSIIRV